jgi:hypothetical protein
MANCADTGAVYSISLDGETPDSLAPLPAMSDGAGGCGADVLGQEVGGVASRWLWRSGISLLEGATVGWRGRLTSPDTADGAVGQR